MASSIRAFNANLLITRELAKDTALTVGYLHTKGTRLPIARNINFTKVISTLADGRPVFSTATADKVYPQFGNVYIDESVGNSHRESAGPHSLDGWTSRARVFQVLPPIICVWKSVG